MLADLFFHLSPMFFSGGAIRDKIDPSPTDGSPKLGGSVIHKANLRYAHLRCSAVAAKAAGKQQQNDEHTRNDDALRALDDIGNEGVNKDEGDEQEIDREGDCVWSSNTAVSPLGQGDSNRGGEH